MRGNLRDARAKERSRNSSFRGIQWKSTAGEPQSCWLQMMLLGHSRTSGEYNDSEALP
jgi:hypothetical protein